LGGEEVVELTTEPALAASDLEGVDDVVAVRPDGDGWRLAVHRLHRSLPALLERIASRRAVATRLLTRHATLEDVFLASTGRRFAEAEAADSVVAQGVNR
jgi:ABC-2 type transport system ATP-binding protein